MPGRLSPSLCCCMCLSSIVFRCAHGHTGTAHLTFENGNEWNIHHDSVEWEEATCDNGASKSLEIRESSVSTDVATHTLTSPQKMKFFSFFYYEWEASNGGGIRLINENEELELGFGTTNPQFMVDDGNRMAWVTGELGDAGSASDFEKWFRVRVEIDWDSSSFTATLDRGRDSTEIVQFDGSLKGSKLPIKKLVWADISQNTWYKGSAMHMRICSVRYETTCSPGQEFDEQQNQCVDCPRGTYHSSEEDKCESCPEGEISDKGSDGIGECSPCPRGTYNTGQYCEICPSGRSSEKRSTSQDDCTTCPPGKYSHQGTACENCPAGKSSERESTSQDHCTTCPPGKYSNEGSGCLLCPEKRISYPGARGKKDCFVPPSRQASQFPERSVRMSKHRRGL
eukprot:gb/GECG01005644.1/.p1 GENE.gb/GECG01005644.1/~~gb/GECG01005644.1/.p1  ORF type:complete len:397 (+),score=47.64 gb/GECG01005644.1/:1-1191(+)